jgi:hypothetical protein
MDHNAIIRIITKRGSISALCEGLTDANRRWLAGEVKRGAVRIVMDCAYPKPVKTWAFV